MKPTTVLLASLLALPFPAPAQQKERPLARVGGEPVYGQEVKDEFVRRHGGHAKFLGGPSELRSFLDQVIDRRLLLQEAYRLELDRLPAIHAATAEYAGSRAADALVAAETERKAEPTEARIREAWETRTTTLYRVLQIVVGERREADAIAAELAAGADFETLARTRSTAPSRIRGGALGEVGWGSFSPEWENAVFGLEAGQTSAPFATPEGWQIVRLLERRTVEKPDYAAAHSRLESILRTRRLDERRKEFADELWAKYHAHLSGVLEITPAALAELVATAPATVLATWDGGELDLGTFARGLDLAVLAALPADRGQSHLDDLLRRTVNDGLVRLEAGARRVEEWPEVAAKIRSYREQLMENALYADYLLRGVEVTDADVRAAYETRRAELVAPERRRVAHILVATREEAEALSGRLALGADFDALAAESSRDAQTAKKGGDLGWVTERETPPDFRPVLTLERGQVSAPLPSSYGWHLVRVTDIEPARPLAFEEVRDELRQQLLDGKRTAVRREWVARLRAATEIRIDGKAIAAFAKKSAEG